jgi:hypothetical protein
VCPNAALVAFVKRPLLDAFAANEIGPGKNLEMLAHSELTNAKFRSDKNAANPILDQIPIGLRWEVPRRSLQPFQNLKPPGIGDGLQNICDSGWPVPYSSTVLQAQKKRT